MFDRMLTRLTIAANCGTRGVRESDAQVSREDLQCLLVHFHRLDSEVRERASLKRIKDTVRGLRSQPRQICPETALTASQRLPVIDDPSHPLYGPVRRLWVVIQTVFADYTPDRLALAYKAEWGSTWEADFTALVDEGRLSIAEAHREMVDRLIIAVDAWVIIP